VFGSKAQTDTITFKWTDNNNEFIFGKSNWKWPHTYPRQGEAINPNYDTIFVRQDSSLFNGYLKILNEEIHAQNDTVKFGNSTYKVINGIPHLTHSFSYAYRHPETKKNFRWKAYEIVVTDSNKISLSFHPNGLIKTKREYKFLYHDTLSYFQSYDSTGTLQMSNEKKGELYDGLFTFRISDSLSLTLKYVQDSLKSAESENITFFNHRNKKILEDIFISVLSRRSDLNWGFLVVDSSIALYLTDEEVEPYVSVKERGLTKSRRRKLVSRMK
jgi:hypothetical protein